MNEAIVHLPLYFWSGGVFWFFGKVWGKKQCSGWKHIAFINRRTICSNINIVGPFLKKKATIKWTKQRNCYWTVRMPPTESIKQISPAWIWLPYNLALCQKDNLSKKKKIKNLNSILHGAWTYTNHLFTNVRGSQWQCLESEWFNLTRWNF